MAEDTREMEKIDFEKEVMSLVMNLGEATIHR